MLQPVTPHMTAPIQAVKALLLHVQWLEHTFAENV